MLGLEGIAVPAGLLLTLLSTVLCAVYGIVNWNRGEAAEAEAPCIPHREEEERERPVIAVEGSPVTNR